ncbi:hypothetical protein CKO25_09495 [Thiocapsa imhoffii]|uniref:Uncharacterized protein n=1 Tax=Thiocapsa imhoffii TaxID=382777 RepID=A0A9X0WHX8_9GAMM|nr:DUF4407 domain-containing protein [Thiocapsa imhoffii]MBK1644878.1 hypothetical protein [Thiocapsa imhoffii]
MELTRRLRPFWRVPSLDFLLLRPYGDSLATPAVRVWIAFVWIIIFLMASIEGVVWGLVGASIVPQATAWLRPIVGLFMFVLMFAVIWIVDASLVMSERPIRPPRGQKALGSTDQPGSGARWFVGLLLRILIVAVSLYVTAPFLAKLIRADDIESHHQRLIEEYYAERDAAFETQVAAQARGIEAHYAGLLQPLEEEIERLRESLASERQRRTQIETTYAPEINVLRAELAAAQARFGDEIHGREERPAGYGPEARRWETRVTELTAALREQQEEIDQRVETVARAIVELETRLASRTDALQQLRREQRQAIERVRAEVAAQQLEENPPRLTFAARSKALQDLRDSPAEAGVPHFETVDGFAQAALAILFFSLIALKLFEPAAVRAYFTESLQLRYRQYRAGGLTEIPGFEHPNDPRRCLNPVEFARQWRHYETDPEGFFAEQQVRMDLAEPVVTQQADQSFQRGLLRHRHENLALERETTERRHEIELDAYEREQRLRAEAMTVQLADEVRAKKDHRVVELELELQRARDAWNLLKAREEAALRERTENAEQSIEQARQERRLHEKELDQQREQRWEELRQTELERQRRHQLELAEQAQRRHREAYQDRLRSLREELTRVRALESEQANAVRVARDTLTQLAEAISVLQERIAPLEVELAEQRARRRDLVAAALGPGESLSPAAGSRPVSRGFWSRSEPASVAPSAREARRELKTLEKQLRSRGERLAAWREELRTLEARRSLREDELSAREQTLRQLQARVFFHEDAIGALLTHDLLVATPIPAPDAPGGSSDSPLRVPDPPQGVTLTDSVPARGGRTQP